MATTLVSVLLAAVSTASFYGQLRGRAWRFLAHGVLLAGLAFAVALVLLFAFAFSVGFAFASRLGLPFLALWALAFFGSLPALAASADATWSLAAWVSIARCSDATAGAETLNAADA